MLVSSSAKLHPEFDLDQAKRVYGRRDPAEEMRGDLVTSPYDLFAFEAARDSLGLRIGRPLPTDVFVFGKGEAPRREATKVGGLPYWPAQRAWPTTPSGQPYHFLAQFNFADSSDLVAGLPGDVLLLLVEPGEDWQYEASPIRLEWLTLGEVPLPSFPREQTVTPETTFFGAIYRGIDYPGSLEKEKELGLWSGTGQLYATQATKIGGLPYSIQDHQYAGDFICQLNSVQAAAEVPYPWVNQEAPLEASHGESGLWHGANQFTFLDMGIVYVFRNADGTFRTEIESY
jgi:hypothetical protein